MGKFNLSLVLFLTCFSYVSSLILFGLNFNPIVIFHLEEKVKLRILLT